MMSIITPTELKTKLELQGVSDTELEDETVLQSLIDLKVDDITALTGIPINPVNRKQIIKGFNGDLFEADWYPIKEVTNFKIGDYELTDDDYVLDEVAGVFYLNKYYTGLLVIEFINQASDDVVASKINPLISDMVLYGFTSLDSNSGEISSIRESEQSISYDTGNSLGNRIYARIDDLKSIYGASCRVKWLV